jgi:hypothetical protein
MNFSKPFGPAASEISEIEVMGDIGELSRGDDLNHQGENAEGEMGVTEFSRLLHRVSGNSKREIDTLIGELQTLREKLESDGQRLQNDVSEYTSLSQEVMQITKIISDSVRKLPDAPKSRP